MKLKEFIENLQNADNAIKKRWLMGLSGVSIIIVVGLWLIYLNYTINSVGTNEIKEPEIGFWRIMASGFQSLFYKIIHKRTIMIE